MPKQVILLSSHADCDPCKEMAPDWEELVHTYQHSGVKFFVYDFNDNNAKFWKYAKKYKTGGSVPVVIMINGTDHKKLTGGRDYESLERCFNQMF